MLILSHLSAVAIGVLMGLILAALMAAKEATP